jgi:pimeloyl-ACP methyl ester carboxylesterase
MNLPSPPREGRVLCLSSGRFHHMHYVEWGDAEDPRVLVCVHGLTRQGRDFDVLADALSAHYRVVCPDVAGRGKSDWLADPTAYTYQQYMADMAVLIAHLEVEAVDWVGTSMGGLIGIMLAALPQTPIRHLVLNDVGPLVPKAALERLAGYVGEDPHFPNLDAAEAYIRRVAAPFGPLADWQWRHLTVHAVREDPQGGYRLAYDPEIAAPLQATEALEDVNLWPVWEAVAAPTLVLRGGQSDLLLPETAEAMTRSGPKADLVEFPECGHAPALLDDHQVALVRDWLLARTGKAAT